jgi:DNA-binding response OmpR family regulator
MGGQRLPENEPTPIATTLEPMTRLVLVADASWVKNEVEAALADQAWQVIQVTDPREAADIIEETAPAVVIVDLQVGSMGGMAVIRDIRQRLDPRPRLVLLLDRSADTFIAGRAGADASVLKPIEPAALRQAVADAPALL